MFPWRGSKQGPRSYGDGGNLIKRRKNTNK